MQRHATGLEEGRTTALTGSGGARSPSHMSQWGHLIQKVFSCEQNGRIFSAPEPVIRQAHSCVHVEEE